MPSSLWQGIILSHWGRTDRDHTSSTGYGPDDYSVLVALEGGGDWRDVYRSPPHPCFDPRKVPYPPLPPPMQPMTDTRSLVHGGGSGGCGTEV